MIKFNTDHLEDWRIKEIEEGGYWILPAHRESRKVQEARRQAETVNYWTVTITLTSGKSKQFYIKAKTYEDAILKAKSYEYLAEIGYPKKFGLMP